MDKLGTIVKSALGVDSLSVIGGGSGCISAGTAYLTSDGRKIFVKYNTKPDARRMFVGEQASLEAILRTKTIIVPRPLQMLESGGGVALIMEYLELSSLRNHAALGYALARLHKSNWSLIDSNSPEAVTKFGFHVPTCCGYLPQSNDWHDDWVEFYCKKIDYQIDLLRGKDSQAIDLWNSLRSQVAQLFDGIEVKPSLLHGDLWSGNAGETSEGAAVFDAASFYGHHEYDLGIMCMFAGFSQDFWDAYFNEIPKQQGFSDRSNLYQLFHNLNHWNHFGSGYRSGSLSIMRRLLKR